jgi:NADH:ubiquinone oxidoreductase subunit 6 (subunit J)
MSAVMFFIGGIGTIAGAVGVVTLRDPFLTVLSLVVHLLFLAVLFLLLQAEFLAAGQVIVYAGAVMVLYVFVVAYVGEEVTLGAEKGPVGGGLRLASAVFGALLLVELFIALLGTGLHGIDTRGHSEIPGFGQPRFIGNLLLTRFLLVFEIASFLLLVAAVGAVVLARRRGGIAEEQQDELILAAELRPLGTGTTAEAVSTLAFAAAQAGRRHDSVEEDAPPPVSAPAGAPAEPEDRREGGGW